MNSRRVDIAQSLVKSAGILFWTATPDYARSRRCRAGLKLGVAVMASAASAALDRLDQQNGTPLDNERGEPYSNVTDDGSSVTDEPARTGAIPNEGSAKALEQLGLLKSSAFITAFITAAVATNRGTNWLFRVLAGRLSAAGVRKPWTKIGFVAAIVWFTTESGCILHRHRPPLSASPRIRAL